MAKKKTGRELAKQTRRDHKKAIEKLEKLNTGELAPTETNPIVPLRRFEIKAITKSLTRQSRVAAAKKGTEGPLTRAIRYFITEEGVSNLSELLAIFELEEGGYAEDLFSDEYGPPIDIHDVKVRRNRERIEYKVRDKCEVRKAKFSTLRNRISKIRNS